MNRPAIRSYIPILVTAVITTAVWVNAGQLDPPAGPISPTGPITINGQDINNNLPLVITQPGNYILTSNIEPPFGYTGHGIIISVSNVTLDLNGFTLIGRPGTGDGIHMPNIAVNVVIRNGNIRYWDGSGIASRILSGRIERISVSQSGEWGIINESSDRVTHIISCEAVLNGDLDPDAGGISGAGSKIQDCVVSGNDGPGIVVSEGSTVSGCTVLNNEGNGIVAGSGSIISGCSVRNNGLIGILAIDSLIRGNSSTNNSQESIFCVPGCVVVENNT